MKPTGKSAWQLAAERLVAETALAEYRKTNYDKAGRRYTRHRQYSLPDWCQALLDAALREENEIETKRIMMLVRTGSVSLI
jgi:hypothetical protein